MMGGVMPESDVDLRTADTQGGPPPLAIRAIARGMSAAVAHAPFLWPVLRRPTRRFWKRAAEHWDERIRPDSREHLAPS